MKPVKPSEKSGDEYQFGLFTNGQIAFVIAAVVIIGLCVLFNMS